MAKNTASKRREVETQNEQEIAEARALAERQRAGDFLRALAAGAAMSALALWSARWGAEHLWAPFSIGGRHTIGSLLVSAIFGGAAAAWAGRGAKAPLPAGACALGWALSATGQHFSSHGKYIAILQEPLRDVSDFQRAAMDLLSKNSLYQPLFVAVGLIVASIAGWAVNRVAQRKTDVAVQQTESPLKAILFAGLVLIVGSLLLWGLGYLPMRKLPAPRLADLPVTLASAVLCCMVALTAYALAGYNLARWFRGRSGAFCFLAAPLAVLITAEILRRGEAPFVWPLLTLLLNSSAFELASWGAFGAVAGFWVRELNRDELIISSS